MITTILLVCALVSFILAAIPVASRINLIALGLVFTTLAALLGSVRIV